MALRQDAMAYGSVEHSRASTCGARLGTGGFFDREGDLFDADLPTGMLAIMKTISSLLLFAVWMFQPSSVSAGPGDQNAQPPSPPHRIAGGDMPLNLLEVDGRWVVSTNSGWHNAYLQI